MSETPDPKPATPPFWLAILKRPLEFGLTGVALVGVLFLANVSDILPRVFKGAGIEVEFQERVVQSTASTEAGVELLKRQVAELQQTVAALRDDVGATVPAAEALETPNIVAEAEADGAAKDSLLINQQKIVQTSGYMWLGTFDPAQQIWTDVSVANADGTPLPPPTDLAANAAVVLTTTLNIRDALPENNEVYFRAVRALGVAETGTNATLLAQPAILDRKGAQQVWAQVSVRIKPYIGVQQSN